MNGSNRWLAIAADPRAPWAAIVALSILDLMQTIYLSGFTGVPGPLWKVWIYEISSAAVLLALVPFAAWTGRRFALREVSVAIVAAHLAASVVFSAIHVIAMVAIRKVVFVLLGHRYDFGPPLRGFAYEYGKDVFTYAIFQGVFALNDWAKSTVSRRAEAQATRTRGGLSVKTPRGNVFVPFAAILRVEAAGNYVTLRATGGEFLHRATMKDMEDILPAEEFARTHRSFIVRLSTIHAIRGGGDGDRLLRLSDGTQIPLSRRYAARREWALPLSDGANAPGSCS